MSISFKDFLIEKRRFPEVNQKVDIVQYISSLIRSGFVSVKKLTDKYGKEYFRNKTYALFSNAINELKGMK